MPYLNMPGVKPMNLSVPQKIASLLHAMMDCVQEQEAIILEEREAMQTFDADVLATLVERRARSQSVLDELESQCHILCKQINIPNTQQPMAYMIEHFAPHQADELQDTRIELVRRMQVLERDHLENHVRLRAAWNVTTNILQHIGAIEMKPTYNSYASQASR